MTDGGSGFVVYSRKIKRLVGSLGNMYKRYADEWDRVRRRGVCPSRG